MRSQKYAKLVWVLALGVCATSAWGQKEQPGHQAGVQTISADQPAGGPTLQQRHPRYVLQRGDTLLVSFPLTPEMNQTLTVQPDGYVNLQSADSVYAQGLTAPELSDAVKKAYAGVLHEPIVAVDVEDFQKPFISVLGQVNKPGQFELRADITVSQALAEAGGLVQLTSKTQIFLFRRTSANWMEVRKVDMKTFLQGKNIQEDPILQAGDEIFVPENFISKFRKYVPYNINGGTYLTPLD